MNKGGWILIALFMGGGIFFWVTQPQIGLGQIWVAISGFLIVAYLFFGIRARLKEGNSSPTGFPPTTQTPGIQSGLASGGPFDSFTVTSQSDATTIGSGMDAAKAIMAALKQHGIDASGGTVDLRNLPAAREAVLAALRDHGVDVAHQVAMVSPAIPIQPSAEPVERMAKLKQLHDNGLISQAEFDENRKRILGQL